MNLCVDSSVWIDYFNGAKTPETDFLHQAIGRENIIVGDIMLAEVLQGFRFDADFEAAKEALKKFSILGIVNQTIAIDSAIYYRLLRRKGITIRKTIDCLIATFCIHNRLTLLHNDRDFDAFEQHFDLDVWKPSIPPAAETV